MTDLRKLAKERKLDELEAAWMERLEEDDPGYEELFGVADYLARKVEADTAGVLLWALVTTAAEKKGAAAALPLARRAAETCPGNASLRQELAAVYAAAHPEIAAMPQLVERSGLAAGAPVGRACDTLDLWAAMKPGSYVIMRNSRRVARVEEFDVGGGKCVIREPRGSLSLDLDAAVVELDVLPDDDLRALGLFEPERLARMAEEDPVGLVELALSQAHERALQFRELREKLSAAVPEEAWPAWWKRARPLLVRAPRVEMSGTTQPTFVLRREGVTYEEETLGRLARARQPLEVIKVALDFARERASSGKAAPEVEAQVVERLRRLTLAGEKETLAAVAAWDQLCEACGDEGGRAEAREAVAGLSALEERIAGVEDDRLARRALALIRQAVPDRWADVFEATMLLAPLRRCEQLARELAGTEKDRLRRVVEAIRAAPDRCPEALAWLWRAVCEEREEAPPGLDRFEVTVLFLALAKRLARTGTGRTEEEIRQLRKLFRGVLAAGEFATVRALVAATDAVTARRLREAMSNNRGLSGDVVDAIHKALQEAHPELFAEQVEPWEDESVIWTTHEGLARRRKDLERLINVDMPRNARAIGEAAARGDLSENAEWTAAIEERNLLARRGETMETELRAAKPIPPDMASSARVSVGSRVGVRHAADGKEETFTFLGPWDTDLPHGVYYYRAPLSLAFMGKGVGDRVVGGEGEHQREFEILSIESAV